MKNIGYIYKYSSSEKKGILIHGQWDIKKQNNVLVISKDLCNTPIKSNSLVYFDYDKNGNAINIERATLCNFNNDVVEYLQRKRTTGIDTSDISYINIRRFLTNSEYKKLSIEEIYNEFLYYYFFDEDINIYDDVSEVNLLNLGYWFDVAECKKRPYYGMNLKEIEVLYELFGINSSSAWIFLLSQLPFAQLTDLILDKPAIQPFLPDEFCLENLDILNNLYGFPSKRICEVFYTHKIEIAKTAEEYQFLFNQLAKIKNDKPTRTYLFRRLNNILNSKFRQSFITELIEDIEKSISNKNLRKELKNNIFRENSYNVLLNIRRFFDIYLMEIDYESIYEKSWELIHFYENLSNNLQYYYVKLVIKKIEDCLSYITLKISKSNKISDLVYYQTMFIRYISKKEKKRTKIYVSSRFMYFENIDDLEYAYTYNFISGQQYFQQLKTLTVNYAFKDFITFIVNRPDFFDTYSRPPLYIKNYFLYKIISTYKDETANSTSACIQMKSYSLSNEGNYQIYDLTSLLIFLKHGQDNIINRDYIEKAIEKYMGTFAKEERNEIDLEISKRLKEIENNKKKKWDEIRNMG